MALREWDALQELADGSRPGARLFTGPRGGRITTAVLRDATHWDDVVRGPCLPGPHRETARIVGLLRVRSSS